MSVHWEILQLEQTFSLNRQPERERERERKRLRYCVGEGGLIPTPQCDREILASLREKH